METVIPTVVKALASSIAKKAVDVLSDHIKDIRWNRAESIEPDLEKHLKEVVSWSERIEFFGLSRAMDTDVSSVSLDFTQTPRRFAGRRRTKDLTEDDLLHVSGHLMLLGDPGAGKTTTVKRLCRRLLTSGSISSQDIIQYPIAIRLRHMPSGASIFEVVAIALGIKWTKEVRESAGGTQSKTQDKPPRLLVGDIELNDAVIKVLEETRPLLCLDGLDEVSSLDHEKLEEEINYLALQLRSARLLVTSRSGGYLRNIEGIDVIELLPLDMAQIKKIAKNCLTDPEKFIKEINVLPYSDALSRPLALMQLIVLYKNYGYLPDQSSAVYQKLTSLYLEEWDYQNRVRRNSKYAGFLPETKFAFLAALSHFLIYHSGKNPFSFEHGDLEYGYTNIYQAFGLPKGEATSVAKEIETHTGILVQTGPKTYEFAHPSLQEYLAASYLVRNPFSSTLIDCLKKYPGPIAITVVLAADPVNWFANLFLHYDVDLRSGRIESSIVEFLRRLRIERPHFYESGILGFAVLSLAFEFVQHNDINSELIRLSKSDAVGASIATAVKAYAVKMDTTDDYALALTLKRSKRIDRNLNAVEEGRVRSQFLAPVLRRYSVEMQRE